MSYSTSGRLTNRGLENRLQSATLTAIILAVVILLLCGTGCAKTDLALRRARANVALNRAQAMDSNLAPLTRAIGAVNAKGWAVQAYLLGGDRLTPELIDSMSPEERAELGLEGAGE